MFPGYRNIYIDMYRKFIDETVRKFIDEIIEEDVSSTILSYNTIWNEYKSWSKQNKNYRKPFGKQQLRGEIEKKMVK